MARLFSRTLYSVLVASSVLVTPLFAQDREQSLADIRTELSALYSEIQNLRNELTANSDSQGSSLNGPALLRLDQIEDEMRRMTGQVENLEFRIDSIVKDGTNRIGDLEFRLVELEGGDITALGKTPTLGGVVSERSAPKETSQAQLAVAEKQDFDAAVRVINDGQYQPGILLMRSFLSNYSNSALSGQAHYWMGVAQSNQGDWNGASRSYLASLKATPDHENAGMAMHGLGQGLAKLGKIDQACKTLYGVSDRYPNNSQAVNLASEEILSLGCN